MQKPLTRPSATLPMNPWEHRTSNIQHPTPNRQSMAQLETIGCSMLDVGCWMFSFGSWVQCANFSGNSFHEPERRAPPRQVAVQAHHRAEAVLGAPMLRRFMVAMRGKKTVEAPHEPRSSGCESAPSSFGQSQSRLTSAWAKALVLAKGERRFALVTADVLGFPP